MVLVRRCSQGAGQGAGQGVVLKVVWWLLAVHVWRCNQAAGQGAVFESSLLSGVCAGVVFGIPQEWVVLLVVSLQTHQKPGYQLQKKTGHPYFLSVPIC